VPVTFVIYLEFTLPAEATLDTMDSFQTLRRVFADVGAVMGTRLLRNTENPKVVLLEVTSSTDILPQVRGALNIPGVKTRAWSFEVLSEILVRDLAQA
jgi:hypothetical protein